MILSYSLFVLYLKKKYILKEICYSTDIKTSYEVQSKAIEHHLFLKFLTVSYNMRNINTKKFTVLSFDSELVAVQEIDKFVFFVRESVI